MFCVMVLIDSVMLGFLVSRSPWLVFFFGSIIILPSLHFPLHSILLFLYTLYVRMKP